MTSSLLFLFCSVAAPWFGPNVRIDHQYLSKHVLVKPAIAVGPGAPSSQPIHVAFEDDSMMFVVQSNIMFQKSTDAGRTWLPTDLLIRRGENFASSPDITTDSDGNVYIVYDEHSHILCVRSSDGGATWSAPARVDDESSGGIGLFSIAADTDGNLFVAWNQLPGGISHVFSSVSTDKGETWSPRVRVDDDTLTNESCHPEVFVQPGTNHYLVAATTYRWFEEIPYIRPCAFLYRSTDRGRTFQPGVQLDTFNWAAGSPHVVADRNHIICNYFGKSRSARGRMLAEARTFFTQADTWGAPSSVTDFDTLHRLYYSGALALSGDGGVHTALIVRDTALYHVYYTSSADHGVSWSDLERVDEDTTLSSGYPDIGADSAGHVYVVWSHGDDGQFRIWFATNNPQAIAEQEQQSTGVRPSATVVRGVLFLAERPRSSTSFLMDVSGRKVLDLRPGANDVRALVPGVYFVQEPQASSPKPQAVLKVIISD